MESCENCGRQIGKLETPRVFGGHVVCAECEQRLRGDQSAPAPDPVTPSVEPEAAAPQADVVWGHVRVTESSLDIGGKTYALRNLASVEMGYEDPGFKWNHVGGLVLLVVGGLLSFVGCGALSNRDRAGTALVTLLAGVLIVVPGVMLVTRKPKRRPILIVTSNARERHQIGFDSEPQMRTFAQQLRSAMERSKRRS